MFRTLTLSAALVAALASSILALAQQDQFGTATEAKVMLEKAVFAVKADKAKALAMFNKGGGGFKDRDHTREFPRSALCWCGVANGPAVR
jgi:hypothetical protein